MREVHPVLPRTVEVQGPVQQADLSIYVADAM